MVDVFAETLYSGNPLAIVVSADGMSEDGMLRFAAEMGFSETAFVSSSTVPGRGYRARFFTPEREIAFAGHPILGTAWVVRHHLAPRLNGPVSLDLAVGRVEISFEPVARGGELAWFVAPPVKLSAGSSAERIAPVLGLAPEDIDHTKPVQVATAGTSTLIVPLRGLDALRRCRPDPIAFRRLASEGFPPRIYLYCTEARDPRNDLSARFFFEARGLREDPATGNGAAYLGAYLLEHGVVHGPEVALRIEQGHEMHRPSLVRLRMKAAGGIRRIEVGGSVIPTVQGALR
jgi:trans-2,3-dihydro-3-hydroxyanthranilate isomerase